MPRARRCARSRDGPDANRPSSSPQQRHDRIAALHPARRHLQHGGFDRAGPPHPPIEIECVSVDLTVADRIRRALERVRYAYGPWLTSVIHFTAYYDFAGEPSPLYDDITCGNGTIASGAP